MLDFYIYMIYLYISISYFDITLDVRIICVSGILSFKKNEILK